MQLATSAPRPYDARARVASVGGVNIRPPLSKNLVDAALDGDDRALRELVTALTPIMQARVARTLLRRQWRTGLDARTFMEDTVQDTFVALLRDGGRLLRSWDPERGMRLESFVGLVAEQRVLATLRSRRRNPTTEELSIDDADLDVREDEELGPEARALSREALQGLLDEVRARLSAMGHELFMSLIVHEEPIASVCARTRLSTSAVQAWSSRLRRLVRALSERTDTPVEGASE